MKKWIVGVVILCLGVVICSGCGSEVAVSNMEGTDIEISGGAGTDDITEQSNNVTEQTEQDIVLIEFTDALGHKIKVGRPKRTAVLTGSLADAWMLAGGKVAAVTQDASDTIEVTDDMVMLGAMKSPNIELLIEQEVDFVILSSAIAEHVDIRSTLENAGLTTAFFDVETFEDYAAMMEIFTNITDRKELYEKNVTAVQTVIEEQLKKADGSAPEVLFLRAYSTGVKAKGSDSMTGQMLKDLGCVNIADSDKSLLKDLSMEVIIERDPDFIFVTTMGESEEAALDMVEELLISNPAWSGLSAVQSGQYYVLQKDLFHSKPNNRFGESYRILADYLYGKN